MKRVKFYMKSGNAIEFECLDISITTTNGNLKEYDVEYGDSKKKLRYICISLIEGITVEDIQ